MSKTHNYSARLTWTGNNGTGTSTYQGYGREYVVAIEGKPDLTGSADPMFRGKADVHNPEDLFVTSISSCHMLTYLALCAKHHISVVAYEDRAIGTLLLTPDGGGIFEQVVLNPIVTITDAASQTKAVSLHDEAHRLCFIAASCGIPISHLPVIRVEMQIEPK